MAAKKTKTDKPEVLEPNVPTMAGRKKETPIDPREKLKARRAEFTAQQATELNAAHNEATTNEDATV